MNRLLICLLITAASGLCSARSADSPPKAIRPVPEEAWPENRPHTPMERESHGPYIIAPKASQGQTSGTRPRLFPDRRPRKTSPTLELDRDGYPKPHIRLLNR